MAFSLDLPPKWKAQKWKVKIRDKERLEPPHVTIMRGTEAWRWGLREQQFLDDEPDPDDVPDELVELLRADVQRLRDEWDAMYEAQGNPVGSVEEDGDEAT